MTTPATALNWQVVTDYRDPRWSVRGTRIAQAVYGFQSRFAIVELRTYDRDHHSHGVEFGIADADTVSDADVKAGKLPEIVKRYPTCEECIEAIDRASVKLQAAWDSVWNDE